MKKSKKETAETRRLILKTAAELFRQNGIQATGVAELMAAVGLTQGGFYRHFASKEQLVAEACAESLAEGIDLGAEGHRDLADYSLDEIMTKYLTINHPDNHAKGCVLAALGSELARSDEKTRAAASAGFCDFVDVVAKKYESLPPDQARARALFVVSALVGAVTMALLVSDPDLSSAILTETYRQLGGNLGAIGA